MSDKISPEDWASWSADFDSMLDIDWSTFDWPSFSEPDQSRRRPSNDGRSPSNREETATYDLMSLAPFYLEHVQALDSLNQLGAVQFTATDNVAVDINGSCSDDNTSGLANREYMELISIDHGNTLLSSPPTVANQPERALEHPGELSTDLTVADNGVIDHDITTGPLRSQRKRRRAVELRCHEPDCTHTGSFPRDYELQRHVAAKHGSGKRYRCPVARCFQHLTRSAFVRADKLTAHIRSVHSLDTLAECPVSACAKPAMTIDLLARHLQLKYHYAEAKTAIINSANTHYRKCPYWRCQAKVTLSSILNHLLDHSLEDLNAMEDTLREESYLLVRKDCQHVQQDGSQHTCCCPLSSILLICPVCNTCCSDHASFEQHLLTAHLLKQHEDDITHYEVWHAQVVPKFMSGAAWEHWNRRCRERIHVGCPHCQEVFKCKAYEVPAMEGHHLSLLRDIAEVVPELYPHRRAILRLFPAFKTHPVFNDLK